MDRHKEIRTLVAILATLIVVGLLFWGIAMFVKRGSKSEKESTEVIEFVEPDAGLETASEEIPESTREETTNATSSEGEGEADTGAEETGRTRGGSSDTAAGAETALTQAEKQLQEALLAAEDNGRPVLLRFGAIWCPGCWQFTEFLERPKVHDILAKHLSDTLIDVDRVEGARVLLHQLSGRKAHLPWYALFDASGQMIAVSDREHQNISFPPETDEDRSHFLAMFQKTGIFTEETWKQFQSELEAFIDENRR